jgi:hypothetical protein
MCKAVGLIPSIAKFKIYIFFSWCRWLTPVILAIQEAEIRRIAVRSQSRKNSSQDPISKKPITKKRADEVAQGVGPEFKLKYHKKKKKMFSQALVAHTCNPSYSGGKDQEDPGSKLAPGN